MRSEKEIRVMLTIVEDEPEMSCDEWAADILRWVLNDDCTDLKDVKYGKM